MVLRNAFAFLLGLWLTLSAGGAEALPPGPAQHFNDYAKVVSPGTVATLDRTLEQFERDASSQIVVAIFPKLPPNSALEDFTVRTFQAWKIGQQGKDNGVALFAFVQERQMRIEVGYGLEGALPDLVAKRIIDNELRPRLQRGDWDGAMTAGVTALMQATRGEYKGTGTAGRGRKQGARPFGFLIFFFPVLWILSSLLRRRGTVYGGSGRSNWGGWYGGGGGGGWGGGGDGGGGGGFSGGGGRSGGGGASGGW